MSTSVIILAGAGHANIQCLKMFAMKPIPGAHVLLVSEQDSAPYSGMLPGFMYGKYSEEEIHFNLWNLCSRAGVTFIRDKITAIDANKRQLSFSSGRASLEYDILSLNLGIKPRQLEGHANEERVLMLKPISRLIEGWKKFLNLLNELPKQEKWKVAVVCGGPAGVETAVAINETALKCGKMVSIHLLQASDRLMESLPHEASHQALKKMQAAGFKIHLATRVVEIFGQEIKCSDGTLFDFDFIFVATEATPPCALSNSGLSLSEKGFLQVNQKLQSISHPEVFAAGDCTHFVSSPLPKAGVFAVRQGRILEKNIRAYAHSVDQTKLSSYRPQKNFLKLIQLPMGEVMATRGIFSITSKYFSAWKEHIDRKFMQRFGTIERSQEMMTSTAPAQEFNNMCLGCGAKVSQNILQAVISQLKKDFQTVMPESVEDCYPLSLQSQKNYLSIDGLRSFLPDPSLVGKVSMLHALSDLWVSGVKPHSLAVSLGVAARSELSQRNYLLQIMSGILSVCLEHGIHLINAHTFENSDDHLSLTVIGEKQESLLRKSGAKVGDLIVMNKPLGTGILLQALQHGDVTLKSMEELLRVFNRPNILPNPAYFSTATDVTGFGLVGHLLEVLEASKLSAKLNVSTIPILSGTESYLAKGYRSYLIDSNRRCSIGKVSDNLPDYLFDPQTNGAVLAFISKNNQLQLDDSWTAVGEVIKSEKNSFIYLT